MILFVIYIKKIINLEQILNLKLKFTGSHWSCIQYWVHYWTRSWSRLLKMGNFRLVCCVCILRFLLISCKHFVLQLLLSRNFTKGKKEHTLYDSIKNYKDSEIYFFLSLFSKLGTFCNQEITDSKIERERDQRTVIIKKI